MVLVNGVYEIYGETVGVAGFMAKAFEKRRARIEVIRTLGVQPSPDIAFSILKQADDLILCQALRVRGITRVTNEPFVLPVEAQKANRDISRIDAFGPRYRALSGALAFLMLLPRLDIEADQNTAES